MEIPEKTQFSLFSIKKYLPPKKFQKFGASIVCINISAQLSSIILPFAILTLLVISADWESRIYINQYKSYLTDVQHEGGSRPLSDNVQKKDAFFIDGFPKSVNLFFTIFPLELVLLLRSLMGMRQIILHTGDNSTLLNVRITAKVLKSHHNEHTLCFMF